MSSPSSSGESPTTAASSMLTVQGLLWVTTSVMNKDVTPSLLHEWYDEHGNDVLQCPGNGGLILRYKNLSESIDGYADPKFADRFAPSASAQNITDAGWPFLALVKLSDLQWLVSQQFIDMPRVSKLLPLEKDGSIGSAFTNWHAGLRSYETVGKTSDASGVTTRPQYILSVQTTNADRSTWESLDKKYGALPGFRSSIRYQTVNGLLEYQEPGSLPGGLALYEFDERPSVTENDHVRTDVWELIQEMGDLSLVL